MAKKKTSGLEKPDAAPAVRKRTTKSSPAAAPVEVVAASTIAAFEPIAQANDSGNGSAARHSAESPSYEQIAEAAYQRFLRRGAEHGRDFEDWVEAERELRSIL